MTCCLATNCGRKHFQKPFEHRVCGTIEFSSWNPVNRGGGDGGQIPASDTKHIKQPEKPYFSPKSEILFLISFNSLPNKNDPTNYNLYLVAISQLWGGGVVNPETRCVFNKPLVSTHSMRSPGNGTEPVFRNLVGEEKSTQSLQD